jgi:hypothetical protein
MFENHAIDTIQICGGAEVFLRHLLPSFRFLVVVSPETM